jgi:hypothetical protein
LKGEREVTQQSNAFFILFVGGLMVFVSGCPSGTPVNQTPIADAGDDQGVSGGDVTMLDASGSSDPDGDALDYQWTQAAGTRVTLESPTEATTSFTAPNIAGTLRFAVRVTDPGGLSSSDTVNIAVQAVDNLAPVADAGDDQDVAGGAVVTLNGAGSFDPDGTSLTYRWRQTGGVAVALSADDIASPTFTAPNIDGSLEFELTVTDVEGLSSTDATTVTVTRVAPALFATNYQEGSVISFANADTVSGDVAPDTTLAGDATRLAGPTDIVISKSGILMVANAAADTLAFFYPVSAAVGDVAPIRETTAGLDSPRSLAYSEADSLVFVSNVGPAYEILVFEPPVIDPDRGFVTGAVLVRTITSADLAVPTGIALVSSDDLYVANNGAKNVLVFGDASGADGDVTPERIISSSAFVDPIDVFVNDSDHLFVLDAGGQVHIFANASTLNGSVEPASTLSIEGGDAMTAMAVDAAGIGYLVDGGAGAVYIFDNLSNRAGSSSPDRTITGPATGLQTPIGLFLREVP